MDIRAAIPLFDLYGENRAFPDILHCETVNDRAALHDWQIDIHRHAGLHQLFLLTSGEAVLSADGVDRPLQLPVLVSMPHLTVHGFRFAKGTAGMVVTIPMAELPQVFGPDSPLATALAAWAVLPAPVAEAAQVAALAAEHRGLAQGRALMLQAMAQQLLTTVARRISAAAPVPPRPYAKRMAAFDALITRHLRDHWRVSDYAAALGMTSTHLNRVTRAETGASAARYVERHLLQEARRMLAYTREPVGAISWHLGYEDAAYFSRSFRRQAGESPLAYRARFQA
ncbi:helix-turn-helix domain-containing protein [Xinfangfangia pollutisoli]|uniref:helix-turn-helix domain-containing protein n=1 Tax=Xinfangfangia pollutisoli TaxID=2865960 RepID=UPI001CD34ABD|nr:helix-turn-helix domain-containing protein [Xinfangfangia pollutisoli]